MNSWLMMALWEVGLVTKGLGDAFVRWCGAW